MAQPKWLCPTVDGDGEGVDKTSQAAKDAQHDWLFPNLAEQPVSSAAGQAKATKAKAKAEKQPFGNTEVKATLAIASNAAKALCTLSEQTVRMAAKMEQQLHSAQAPESADLGKGHQSAAPKPKLLKAQRKKPNPEADLGKGHQSAAPKPKLLKAVPKPVALQRPASAILKHPANAILKRPGAASLKRESAASLTLPLEPSPKKSFAGNHRPSDELKAKAWDLAQMGWATFVDAHEDACKSLSAGQRLSLQRSSYQCAQALLAAPEAPLDSEEAMASIVDCINNGLALFES